ncbi:hypothetical protein TVAG_426730 [Trichomonas vaginalis G3]|uniref:Uncharacterized protein n=1 Tax=Trichomonas vaginalis (strain ATCC PRA-98 / G3) TaxID=412133 RepID=A2DYT9_TRIV3|nr:hypothetical protein TVAGG3_0538630 [Trichomonas vaginalis G3]EAY14479.1 hypothetical protein TVAG_426730 [Trichomonas vaginalis G3]KAI5519671.1 hypothetical protein TVAGG3_0538630 [Trichomonas vaginalis G3]|eukprot:XP_001326702.1 hypothetical protein [Trichomonas vaginalis G3]
MSKIPRLSTGTKIPRPNMGGTRPMTKIDSNIPRKSISKERRSSIKPDKFFHVKPTMKKLNERVMSTDIINHAFSLKSDKAEAVWNYSKTICSSFFQQKYIDIFYSSLFSTAKTNRFDAKNRMDRNRTTQLGQTIENAIKVFNDMYDENPASLYALADFCLLYLSLIISICNIENCAKEALFFTRKFLQNDMMPSRPNECIMLFTAIMNICVETPTTIGICKQIIYNLAKANPDLNSGVEKGVTRKNKTQKEICEGALEILSKVSAQEQLAQSTEVDITSLNDEEEILATIASFNRPNAIKKPADYVRDLLITMQKFPDNYAIIIAASNSIQSNIEICTPIDRDIIGELLSVIITTVMPSQTANQDLYTDAVFAVNNLFGALVDSHGPEEIIQAAPGAHILLNAEGIEKLNEYIESLNQTSHEPQKQTKVEETHNEEPKEVINPGLQKSIELLLDPATIFTEMERIIYANEDLLQYPIYLRGFLQRSYYLYKKVVPPQMNDYQLSLAKEMLRDLESGNKEDEQPGGKLHVDTLMSEFEKIKNIIED